jgi:hypothetical protein
MTNKKHSVHQPTVCVRTIRTYSNKILRLTSVSHSIRVCKGLMQIIMAVNSHDSQVAQVPNCQ